MPDIPHEHTCVSCDCIDECMDTECEIDDERYLCFDCEDNMYDNEGDSDIVDDEDDYE